MERVGVRELRQHLSVYLRRVAKGEALTVTERGQPVAVLAPLPTDGHPLADLVAAGKATAARQPLSTLEPPSRADVKALSDVLQAMRDEDAR